MKTTKYKATAGLRVSIKDITTVYGDSVTLSGQFQPPCGVACSDNLCTNWAYYRWPSALLMISYYWTCFNSREGLQWHLICISVKKYKKAFEFYNLLCRKFFFQVCINMSFVFMYQHALWLFNCFNPFSINILTSGMMKPLT